MKKLIQIGKFQISPDGLGLLSEADGFPFLVVSAEGVTFDAGPFTGSFCDLKGLSKFTVQRETNAKNSACSVQLTFAEGDSYFVGGFAYGESRYKDACCWVEAANRKIALRKRDSKEDSVAPTQEVSPFNEVDVKQHRIVVYIAQVTD